jgi:hypothetical protein
MHGFIVDIGQYAHYTCNIKHEIVSLLPACVLEGTHYVLLHYLAPKEVNRNVYTAFLFPDTSTSYIWYQLCGILFCSMILKH